MQSYKFVDNGVTSMELNKIDSLSLYLVIYFFSAFFVYLSKTSSRKIIKKATFTIAILLPTMLAYFRYGVGSDFRNYQIIYKGYSNMKLLEFISSRELFYGWGVWLFAKIAKLLGGEAVFFGLFALFTYLFFLDGLKIFKHINWFLISFVYLLSTFSGSLNTMKQVLAVNIVFWGIKYVYERSFTKYILTVIVACMFHTTALVVLPIYFLYGDRKDFKIWNFKVAFAIFGGVVIALKIVDILALLTHIDFMNLSRFSIYAVEQHGTRNLSFFIQLFELFIIVAFQYKLVRVDRKYGLLIVVITLGLGFSLTGFFSTFIKRISEYFFSIPSYVLISSLPQTIGKGRNKAEMDCVIAFMYMLLFIIGCYILGQADLIPYRFR